MKWILVIVGLSGFSAVVDAQTVMPEARIERLAPIPRVITQPIVSDSILLFNAPWLVWRCTYEKDGPEVEWFDADFSRVQGCTGTQEIYELVARNRSYTYKLRSSTERAHMTRASDSTFHYVESYFNDSDTLTESVHWYLDLVYDAKHPLRVDTLYYEDLGSGEMQILVTRFVELRRLRD